MRQNKSPLILLLFAYQLLSPIALIECPDAARSAPSLAQDELIHRFRNAFENIHLEQANAALQRFREGCLAYLNKDYAQAIRTLSHPDIFSSTYLGDYARYLLGSSYHSSGAHAEAEAQFEKLLASYPDSILRYAARVRSASCEKDLGRYQTALQKVAPLASAKCAPLLLFVAECYEALGDGARARDAYERIYYELPTSQEASVAKAKLRLLGGPAGRLGRPDERYFKRIDLLIEAGRYKDALRELRAPNASSLKGPQLGKLNLRLGRCYYGLRQYARALLYLKRASTSVDAQARASALYHLAQCYNRLDKFADYVSTLERMEAQFPNHPLTEESLYLLAISYESERDFERARQTLMRLSARFPQGRYSERAAWKLAWLNYLDGRYQEAAVGFRRCLESWPRGGNRHAALFWLGRTYERLNNGHMARRLYMALIDESPNSLYGSLARERLNRSSADQEASAASSAADLEGSKLVGAQGGEAKAQLDADRSELSVRLLKFRQLYAIGFEGWALSELDFLALDWEARVSLYAYWPESTPEADTLRRIRILKRFFPDYHSYDIDRLPRQIWELFYPLRMWRDIRAVAERYGLDPYLLAAVIRQESTFNPQAVSRARAIGLMQIVPSTGRQIARQLGYRYLPTRKLYDPRINLQVGTYYLARLLEKFNGQIELALAAYNGGISRVSAWIRRYSTQDIYELIESIPIAETREYVKMVLASAAHYRLLYGGD